MVRIGSNSIADVSFHLEAVSLNASVVIINTWNVMSLSNKDRTGMIDRRIAAILAITSTKS